MARSTDDHRNDTRIGLNAELGDPWHGEAHFAGAVPLDEAIRFLTIPVVEKEIYVLNVDSPLGISEVPNMKAIVQEETGHVYQVTSGRWVKHDYVKWLIENVMSIVDASDGELEIGSVIRLGHGEQACVQIRPPKGVTVGGDMVLPWLAAYSSMDSSLATGYKPTRTRIVCRNTQAASLLEKTYALLKYKHTKNSEVRMGMAREALGIVFEIGEDTKAEMEQLMNTSFVDAQFAKLLDIRVEVPVDKGQSKTLAEKKRYELTNLWNNDMRVAPFRGTAWGAIQAFNTHTHHIATVRNTDRLTRQAKNLITGATETSDREVMEAINLVLAH